MTLDEVRNQLSAYLDGQLPTHAKERVEEHLQSCANCSRKLEETRSIVAEMRRLPQAKPPRSFALSPEIAAATRREGDRSRLAERATARRVYLGLSGATVAAAVLLIAVVGSDVAFFSRGSNGQTASGAATSLSREAAPSPSEENAQMGAITEPAGEGQDNVAPGVAPPLPSAVATDKRSSAEATPPPASTPYGTAAAAPQQAQPVAENASHLWLWVVEGAAGGLIVGFGASAFWMRRRWVQINRS